MVILGGIGLRYVEHKQDHLSRIERLQVRQEKINTHIETSINLEVATIYRLKQELLERAYNLQRVNHVHVPHGELDTIIDGLI